MKQLYELLLPSDCNLVIVLGTRNLLSIDFILSMCQCFEKKEKPDNEECLQGFDCTYCNSPDRSTKAGTEFDTLATEANF